MADAAPAPAAGGNLILPPGGATRTPPAGVQNDVVAALILCSTDAVDYSFINGRRVVDRGRLTTVDLPVLVENTNRLAARLVAPS